MTANAEPDSPENWAQSDLNQVARLVKDKVEPAAVPDDTPYVGLEHVEAHTMKLLSHGRASDVKSAKTRFSTGDVLYGKLRPYLNKVALPDFDGICSTDFLVFGESSELDRRYLAHYLNQLWVVNRAHDLSNGVELPRVDWKSLGQLPVAYPMSKAAQRSIVCQIDRVTDLRSNALSHLLVARRAIERFGQSVLSAACSGGLTEDWREQIDAEADERLPPGWRQATVESLAASTPRAIQSGPFGSNLKHSEFRADGRLVIGIDNVLNGEFSFGKEHRISPQKFEELQKYQARPLDVLITVMATIGRVCVVPGDIEPAITTKHVYRITVDTKVLNPYFLMHALRGDPTVTEQIQWQVRGQTRPGINGQIVKGLVVPVPPIDEQNEIVGRVSTLMDMSRAILERVEASTKAVERSSQAVLAKAFRGELTSYMGVRP